MYMFFSGVDSGSAYSNRLSAPECRRGMLTKCLFCALINHTHPHCVSFSAIIKVLVAPYHVWCWLFLWLYKFLRSCGLPGDHWMHGMMKLCYLRKMIWNVLYDEDCGDPHGHGYFARWSVVTNAMLWKHLCFDNNVVLVYIYTKRQEFMNTLST